MNKLDRLRIKSTQFCSVQTKQKCSHSRHHKVTSCLIILMIVEWMCFLRMIWRSLSSPKVSATSSNATASFRLSTSSMTVASPSQWWLSITAWMPLNLGFFRSFSISPTSNLRTKTMRRYSMGEISSLPRPFSHQSTFFSPWQLDKMIRWACSSNLIGKRRISKFGRCLASVRIRINNIRLF